ncbi:MAG TPA: hypothetical protein PKD09_16950 [Aggregatilinea sp.]|jgi:hypothetical protein|uniref:hypothetical protein n=1 Tax=Aggregatilinea sp. TaxID=2806333 RepID=UPI002CED18A2|nr:hypothetical protein [Aggregatilinea sp.]HML23346.1 hypothetical protein [Aggregatilinea sp.]
MSRLLSVLVLLALLAFPLSVFAQGDATQLSYGDVVTGEISNQSFEVPYTFTGAEGDVVLIEMRPVDTNVFYSPSLILLDTDFNPIASVDGYDVATLAVQLPADGDYNLLATRTDGRAGDGQGEYSLSLMKPPAITAGEVTTATIGNEETQYYTIDLTTPVTLVYEHVSGDFYPAVTINEIVNYYDNYLELTEVASISGNLITSASVSLQMGAEATSPLYVITVAEGLWDWNYEPVTGEYTLTLAAE